MLFLDVSTSRNSVMWIYLQAYRNDLVLALPEEPIASCGIDPDLGNQ
jgi:hypothetical protein